MKNIKLLIITLLFSSLLMACGMKGPLYRTPSAQPAPSAAMENKEKSETPQNGTTAATIEKQANCSTNITTADKPQAVTEDQADCSTNTTAADEHQEVAKKSKSEKTTVSE